MSPKIDNSSGTKELAKLLSKLRINDTVDATKLAKEDPKIVSNLFKITEEVAQHFPLKAAVHRPILIQYIISSKIKTKGQLHAACEFFSTLGSKKLNVKEFERFCGIGITEAETFEIMKKTVDDIYEMYKSSHMSIRKSDEIMAEELKAHVQKRMQWADPLIYSDYILEKLSSRKYNHGKSCREKKKEKYQEFLPDKDAAQEKSKIKVHAKGVDVGKRPLNELFVLGQRIRAKITTSHDTPYKTLFILPSDEEVEKDPYCLMRLTTNSYEVTYIICKKDLYVVAWITSEENVVRVFKTKEEPPSLSGSRTIVDREFEKIKASIEKMPVFQCLKPRIVEFAYPGSYIDLEKHAEKFRYEIVLGRKSFEDAIYTLCDPSAQPKETAKALIISVQMLSELMRLRQQKNFVRSHYETGKMPSPKLVNLQNNWSKMCKDLIKWAETGEYFEITIDGTSYSTKEISHSILIAKRSGDRSS